ncbi:cyclopropane-fatty-acyl-phospholipid synthase family protein [Sandaracinobacter sp. RS1-74]|uniref:SAM-dependent methyltransferase n=1 Tax=Sandaracinobacteroides sayramensis TaxID=2913411 RepID=UPI001EDB73E9|nr:cyclopropane-fatty-acyl-phospholipid synthase family protein [Sandaracinobacteroides sayramensis]MCG2840163.1 cyclopropane-fatty-acyl-phospholipid synthase family protein [Sandaracinobacteroides sayramensis]
MWLLDRLLRRAITRGALEIQDHAGHVHRYGDPAATAVKLRLTDAATERKIATNPTLGAGEAFMDGRLIVESGDVMDLLDVVGRNLRWDRGNALRVSLWNQQRIAAKWDEWNARARSKRNVAHHYDLSDKLYDLFLDEERQYSCGYFRDGNVGPDSDLDRAQRDKLDHIVAKLRLNPGMKVLDIGCGWGGMARHIHKLSGAEVLGVTLSEEQLKYARAKAKELGIDGKVRYELMDYRDVEGPFDRIVSVGMFEHVGRPNYFAYFDKVASLLAPDGVALVHSIGRAGGKGATDPWTAKYIFPGGYTPALSEMMPHVERAYLWVADIEVWRLHYAYTLEHWLKRCRARKAEIVALYDERFFRMWEFYLGGAILAFRHDDHVVYQLQLTRQRDAVPLTRDYLYKG